MPIIEAHLIAGYDAEAKARLGRALTGAVRQVIPAALEAVTVMIREVPQADYLRGGEHRQPAPPEPDPVALVRGFLSAMEARDLESARAFLADGFTMHFPGQPPMHTLEELVAWSKPRYRSVAKSYDGFDVTATETAVVVYAFGTLHGEWLDGTAFSGIRFIDRFEVVAGRFTRQDVWNDMGETLAAAR